MNPKKKNQYNWFYIWKNSDFIFEVSDTTISRELIRGLLFQLHNQYN